ncbi:hypothetical protein AYO37_00545 [Opitutia bacterium SCGC AG-212-L18]|nr:hypothetical protein AYO37_00545 [Opitutae bacterium SCGC AG-212-L18]
MSNEILSVLQYMEKEKGIPREDMISAISAAIVSSAQKGYGPSQNLKVDIDPKTGALKAWNILSIVDSVSDPTSEIHIEKAREFKPNAQIGQTFEKEIDPSHLGRIAAQAAKQAIVQRIRQFEKERLYEDFKSSIGDIVSGIVRRRDRSDLIIDLGKTEAVLPANEVVDEAKNIADQAAIEFQAAKVRADLAQKINEIKQYQEKAEEAKKCVNNHFETNQTFAGECVKDAEDFLNKAKETAEAANLKFGKNDEVDKELKEVEKIAAAAHTDYENLEEAAINKKLGLIGKQKVIADQARQDLAVLVANIAIYDTIKAEDYAKSATEALDRAKNLANEIPDVKSAKEDAQKIVGEIETIVAEINKAKEAAEEVLTNKVQAVINQKVLAQEALDNCIIALVGSDPLAPDFSSYETSRAQKCVQDAIEAANQAETLANEIPNSKEAKAAKDEAKAAKDKAKALFTDVEAILKGKVTEVERRKEWAKNAVDSINKQKSNMTAYDRSIAEDLLKNATLSSEQAADLAKEIRNHANAQELAKEAEGFAKEAEETFDITKRVVAIKEKLVVDQKNLANQALQSIEKLIGNDPSNPDFKSYKTSEAQICVTNAKNAVQQAENLAARIPYSTAARKAADDAKAAAVEVENKFTTVEGILTAKVTAIQDKQKAAQIALTCINDQAANMATYNATVVQGCLKAAKEAADDAQILAEAILNSEEAKLATEGTQKFAKQADEAFKNIEKDLDQKVKAVIEQQMTVLNAHQCIIHNIGGDSSSVSVSFYDPLIAQACMDAARTALAQAEILANEISNNQEAKEAVADAKTHLQEAERLYAEAERILAQKIDDITAQKTTAQNEYQTIIDKTNSTSIKTACQQKAKDEADVAKSLAKNECEVIHGAFNATNATLVSILDNCIADKNNTADAAMPSTKDSCIKATTGSNKLDAKRCLKNADSAAAEAQKLAAMISKRIKKAQDEAGAAADAAREANKVLGLAPLNNWLIIAEDAIAHVYNHATNPLDIATYVPVIKNALKQAQLIVKKIVPDAEVEEILSKIEDIERACGIKLGQILAGSDLDQVKDYLNDNKLSDARKLADKVKATNSSVQALLNEMVSHFKAEAEIAAQAAQDAANQTTLLIASKQEAIEQGIETCQKTVEDALTKILSVNIQDLPSKDSLMSTAETAFEEAKKLENVISDQSYLALESMKERMALIYQNIAEASLECIKDTLAEKEAACIGWYCLEKVTYASTQVEALAKKLSGYAHVQEAAIKAREKRDSCYDLLSKDWEVVECLKQGFNKDKEVMEIIQKLYFKQETREQKMKRLKTQTKYL